jgi:hypothetical protein
MSAGALLDHLPVSNITTICVEEHELKSDDVQLEVLSLDIAEPNACEQSSAASVVAYDWTNAYRELLEVAASAHSERGPPHAASAGSFFDPPCSGTRAYGCDRETIKAIRTHF